MLAALLYQSSEFNVPQLKTTIVLGAGASAEAKLPTGAGLKRMIAKSLNFSQEIGGPAGGDHTLLQALQREGDIVSIFDAARMMHQALPQASSIDEFIDNHRGKYEIERCGKIAIVKSILDAERKSLLYVDPRNSHIELNFDSIEETWFNRFWQQITKGCLAQQLAYRFGFIAFIVFNYDRCLEHFLFQSIQNYYGLSKSEAAELVRSIEIYHPYGTIGSLPWSGGQAKVEFGAEPEHYSLGTLANEIKTFTEGTNPESSDVEKIRRHVASADRLIFLGFAYHQQNIELLKGNGNYSRDYLPRCWGTAHGISSDDQVLIESDVRELYGGRLDALEIKDIECRELFERYSRALSFV